MSHSLLIEVTEVPQGHYLGENYLRSIAEGGMASTSALTQLWAPGPVR